MNSWLYVDMFFILWFLMSIYLFDLIPFPSLKCFFVFIEHVHIDFFSRFDHIIYLIDFFEIFIIILDDLTSKIEGIFLLFVSKQPHLSYILIFLLQHFVDTVDAIQFLIHNSE